MKNTYLILFLSLFVLSCNINDDNNNCHPETTLTTSESEKEITFEFNEDAQRNHYQVVNGNKLVFHFNHVAAQCDDIIDDEWGEILIFQIEDNIQEFEFIDDEILSTNCFYYQYGAWVSGHQQNVQKGLIKGVKTSDNTWEVIIDIETNPINQDEPTRSIDFEGKFNN